MSGWTIGGNDGPPRPRGGPRPHVPPAQAPTHAQAPTPEAERIAEQLLQGVQLQHVATGPPRPEREPRGFTGKHRANKARAMVRAFNALPVAQQQRLGAMLVHHALKLFKENPEPLLQLAYRCAKTDPDAWQSANALQAFDRDMRETVLRVLRLRDLAT
jgi:hypothetical protein